MTFEKFEKFWQTLWNFIYTIIAHLGLDDEAGSRVDEDFTIPGITF